jgi:hypothetical protein
MLALIHTILHNEVKDIKRDVSWAVKAFFKIKSKN